MGDSFNYCNRNGWNGHKITQNLGTTQWETNSIIMWILRLTEHAVKIVDVEAELEESKGREISDLDRLNLWLLNTQKKTDECFLIMLCKFYENEGSNFRLSGKVVSLFKENYRQINCLPCYKLY